MLTDAHNNRRTAARIRASFPVWIRNGNSTFEEASMVNLSQGGAAVNWNGSALNGNIHVVVKAQGGEYLTFSATTAWQRGTNVGLQFSDCCRRGRQFLDLSVYSQLAVQGASLAS